MEDPRQFVYIIRPHRPDFRPDNATPEELERIGAHWNYLVEAYRRGEIVFVGRTTEAPFIGHCVFTANDAEAALAFAQRDPAIAAGVFDYEVHSYKAFMLSGEQTP